MNVTTARTLITLGETALVKADRKTINPALFAAKLPTLGDARSMSAYFAANPTAELAIRKLIPAPKVARTAPAKKATTREVPEFIVRRAINRAAKAAAKAA